MEPGDAKLIHPKRTASPNSDGKFRQSGSSINRQSLAPKADNLEPGKLFTQEQLLEVGNDLVNCLFR